MFDSSNRGGIELCARRDRKVLPANGHVPPAKLDRRCDLPTCHKRGPAARSLRRWRKSRHAERNSRQQKAFSRFAAFGTPACETTAWQMVAHLLALQRSAVGNSDRAQLHHGGNGKQRFLKDVATANRTVVRGVATDTGYGSASNMVIAIARIAAIALSVYLITRGEITVAPLWHFSAALADCSDPCGARAASIKR